MTRFKSIAALSNRQLAILIALVVFVLLLATAPQIGVTWDEPAYIAAAKSYSAWLAEIPKGGAFEQHSIDAYWTVNHEHPPMDKLWSGVVWLGARHVFDDLTAHRMGNMLLAALLAGMLFTLTAEVYDRRVGVLSVAALFSMPRFFFHSHLASLDVPAAVTILLVVLLFWRTRQRRGWWYGVLLGVAWGVGMATKVNAFFVMPALFIWLLLFQREWHLFVRLAIAGAVAFGVFLLSWPWLYPALVERVIEYVLFITVDHWEIGQYYLGQFHMPPPWHFPFVMIVAVVPTMLLIATVIGGRATLRETDERRGFGVLLLLNAALPVLVLTLGKSMVYDNERLFIPAFVFLAPLAGMGIMQVYDWARERVVRIEREELRKSALVGVLALFFVPQLWAAGVLFPHLLSYYSASVGGARGAYRIGLESTYWCETYNEALGYLNAHTSPGDLVWVDPYSHDVMLYYQDLGMLRDDIYIWTPEFGESLIGGEERLRRAYIYEADYAVVHHRQTSYVAGGQADGILQWIGPVPPLFQFSYQDVPLIEIYPMPRH